MKPVPYKSKKGKGTRDLGRLVDDVNGQLGLKRIKPVRMPSR